MHPLPRPALLAASAALAGLVPAQDILYGIRNSNVLVRIDTTTLVAVDVGAVTGYSGIGGLAFGNDHRLYGLATGSDQLIAINTTTAAATLIGSAGVAVTFSTGLGNDPLFDVLYGVAQGGVGLSSVLVTYSKLTGAATTVGDTGANAIVGLEFDAAGQLWGIDGGTGNEELIRIDKTTGARVVVGANGLAAYPSTGGFGIGQSGTFWAVNSVAPAYQLLRIDPGTGAPTLVGTLTGIPVSGLTGLAADRCAGMSGEAVRLGSPANPNAFRPGATTGPVLGRTWDPFIDHTTFLPGALGDILVLSDTPFNVASPFGTVLCDVIGRPHILLTAARGARFQIPIPNQCSFVGLRLCSQGGAFDLATVRLTNAIDLALGTF
jgi:hypothetical protein